MLGALAQDETSSKYSYVTFDDIQSITSFSQDSSQPFLVIRAPKGTVLEVPCSEPETEEEEYPYKMKLTSQEEEILMYVVSNKKSQEDVNIE